MLAVRLPVRAPVVAMLALGCLIPASVAAAPPLRDRFPVEAEFGWPPMSDACGFPVTLEFAGTFDIRVFTKRDGSAREIDAQPGTKLTYRSENGEYSVPFSGSLHTSYPEGIFVGAPAHATLTGNSFGAVPFTGPGSGRIVLDGFIEEAEDGFAFTRLNQLVSTSGDFTSETDRICDALAV